MVIQTNCINMEISNVINFFEHLPVCNYIIYTNIPEIPQSSTGTESDESPIRYKTFYGYRKVDDGEQYTMIDFYQKKDILYVKYIDTSKNYTSYTILDKTNVVSVEILKTSDDPDIPAKIPDNLKNQIGLKLNKILRELKNTKYVNIMNSFSDNIE